METVATRGGSGGEQESLCVELELEGELIVGFSVINGADAHLDDIGKAYDQKLNTRYGRRLSNASFFEISSNVEGQRSFSTRFLKGDQIQVQDALYTLDTPLGGGLHATVFSATKEDKRFTIKLFSITVGALD